MSNPEVNSGFQDVSYIIHEAADMVLLEFAKKGLTDVYALGNLVTAIALIDGVDVAHEYARHVLESGAVDESGKAHIWTLLIELGDPKAILQARCAIGLASEQTSFVEDIGAIELSGLHSAEHLVKLAVALRDDELTRQARRMASGTYITERASLLAKLYSIGDAQSLELAINAAREAYRYQQETGDRHYVRSDKALTDMAVHAVSQGNIDDARQLLEEIKDPYYRVTVELELYKYGHQEALAEIEKYQEEYSTEGNLQVERQLALLGHRKSVNNLERRIRKGKYSDEDKKITDLITLHKLGNKGASRTLKELLLSYRDSKYYIGELIEAGLPELALRLAKQAYAQEPRGIYAEYIWHLEPTTENWQNAFDAYMRRDDDARAFYSSIMIARLASCKKQG
jgi:hypothetical protein